MKKIITLIIALLICAALVACGGNNDAPVNETAGTEDNNADKTPEKDSNGSLPEGVNPDDYAKFVQFELPEGSFREVAVDYMLEQASIEWTPGKTFTYGNEYDNWSYKLTYEAGKVYHGLPYTHLSASIGEFKKVLAENNGKYTASSDSGYEVMGAQCNSSICHAFQQFTPIVCMTSDQYMPSYKDDFVGKVLGNYTVPDGVKKTEDIIKANTPEIIYEAYALADKGDVIMSKNDDTGVTHDRMVSDKAFITRNASGKINPNRSYLVTVEQTDTFDSTRKDGVNTTWWIDHKYTFTELYSANYIPVTFEVFETNIGVIPYLALDEVPSTDLLSRGMLTGTVSSDYPVRYCHISLYDANDKLVSREIQQNNYDVKKVGLRKYSVKLFDGVEAGDYTIVIEAGICRGDAELFRADFTYNG